MKVICVNNEYVGLSLTVGRWYEVGNRFDGMEKFGGPDTILIKDDGERWTVLDRKYFKTVEEHRDERIEKLLNHEERI